MKNRNEIMESINNSAYLFMCECPKCGKRMERGRKEEIKFCSKCGQKLHLRVFTEEELRQARFDRSMDDYED